MVSVPRSIPRCACLALLALLAISLTAQTPKVDLRANLPQYNFQVLPGSERQISVSLRGGTKKTVDWQIGNTTGGATATIDRQENAIGTVKVTIGPVAGKCSITGSLGNYAVHSPATVTILATSTDDRSQTAKFLFNVCAKTTRVAVTPAYQQAYQGQVVQLQSYVLGNTDEAGQWSITTQPSHGDGLLADTDKRDAAFSATVPGRYLLTFTSKADPAIHNSGIIYVSPNAIPSYGRATPNHTQSTECYPDPALKGKTYEVGPGLAYTSLNSVPFDRLSPGSIVRIHNTDQTGNHPSTWHETIRMMSTGRREQPLVVCGVPDAKGNLPVIDAQDATSTPWNGGSTQEFGAVSLWGRQTYNGRYVDGSSGPDFVVLTGLEIRNANGRHNFLPAEGGMPRKFNDFASCINVRSGTYTFLAGNDLHDCGNGLFIANNSAAGFSQVTQFDTIRGNFFHQNGVAGDPGKHHLYTNAWYSVIEANRFGDLVGTGGGNAIKDRGLEPIHRYNLIQTQNAGYLVALESETDSQPYVAFEPYLGAAHATKCLNPYCDYDNTVPPDHIAAYQESLEHAFLYGNIYSGRSVALADLKLADSGGGDGYNFANQSEMGDHLGITYFYNNTVDQPGLAVFATLSGTNNGSTPQQQFFKPRVFAANNIFYKAKTGKINIFALARNASFIGEWQTNLLNKGSFTIAKPILGDASTDLTPVYGWHSYTDAMQYPLDIPIDTHQTGLTPANFLSTPRTNLQPYNAATYAPLADGGAVSAGSPITHKEPALLPVRFQYNAETSYLEPRTRPTTIGAVESGAMPPLVAMEVDPASAAILRALKSPYYTPRPIRLICHYADGLASDCGPQATFTSSSPRLQFHANNALTPEQAAGIPATGTVTATLEGITTKPIPFEINGPHARQD